MDEELPLWPDEAADFLTEHGLPTTKGTLAKWRCKGCGPLYQKYGSRIRYLPSRLIAFRNSRISAERRSTNEAA
jgi:hypothetical protein